MAMRKGHRSLRAAVVFFLGWVSWAVSAHAVWLRSEISETDLRPKETTSSFQTNLQVMQSSYLTDASLPTQSNSYGYVLPRLHGSSGSPSVWNYSFDIAGVLPLSDEGETHVFFPELFFGWKEKNGASSLTLGRKLQVWSEVDSHFGLGVWQPLFRWDHVRPLEMGFTGLHYNLSQGPLQIRALVSPLFLPDQQADFQVTDGEIVSGNRWFRRPIHSVELGNSVTQIRYQVEEPSVRDVVSQVSYALGAQLSAENGLYVRASGADKPMNQFHLSAYYEGEYDDIQDRLLIHVSPYVVRHQVGTLEAGVHNPRALSGVVSMTRERVSPPPLPERWEQTELVDSNYFGLLLSHPLRLFKTTRSKLVWGYVERQKGQKAGREPRVEGEIDASVQRLPFRRWHSLKWTWDKYLGGKKELRGNLGYNFSPDDKGEWISMDLSLVWSPRWTYFLSSDFFGADTQVDFSERSFISLYQNNDRVSAGFRYVF